jgi:hypothetical protein
MLAACPYHDFISPQACYKPRVRHLVIILMCLTACLSLGRGSVVHAMAPDFPEFVVGADQMIHADSDNRRCASCSIDHKAVPHHHGACHGHKLGIPPEDGVVAVTPRPAVAFTPMLTSLAPDARPDAAIRPPQA